MFFKGLTVLKFVSGTIVNFILSHSVRFSFGCLFEKKKKFSFFVVAVDEGLYSDLYLSFFLFYYKLEP